MIRLKSDRILAGSRLGFTDFLNIFQVMLQKIHFIRKYKRRFFQRLMKNSRMLPRILTMFHFQCMNMSGEVIWEPQTTECFSCWRTEFYQTKNTRKPQDARLTKKYNFVLLCDWFWNTFADSSTSPAFASCKKTYAGNACRRT